MSGGCYGPGMARRRRRHPLIDPAWDLERASIGLVIRELEAEGREVTGLEYPDHDWDHAQLDGRRPVDATLLIDGRPAAIDETGSWPKSVATAAARASERATAIRKRLLAERLQVGLSVMATFDLVVMRDRKDGRQFDQDVDDFTATLVEVASRGPMPQVAIAEELLPDWLTKVTVSVLGPPHRSATVSIWAPWDPARVAERLEEIVAKKRTQFEGWGLGIVAILHSHGSRQLMAQAIAARGQLPFWRVYWIDAGHTYLIWDRDAS